MSLRIRVAHLLTDHFSCSSPIRLVSRPLREDDETTYKHDVENRRQIISRSIVTMVTVESCETYQM